MHCSRSVQALPHRRAHGGATLILSSGPFYSNTQTERRSPPPEPLTFDLPSCGSPASPGRPSNVAPFDIWRPHIESSGRQHQKVAVIFIGRPFLRPAPAGLRSGVLERREGVRFPRIAGVTLETLWTLLEAHSLSCSHRSRFHENERIKQRMFLFRYVASRVSLCSV